MSRPRPWKSLTPSEKVEAVRPLEAAGDAQSIIAWKLRAPKYEIARICRLFRRQREAVGEEHPQPVSLQEPHVEAEGQGGVKEQGREEGSQTRLPSDPAENKADGPSVIAADKSQANPEESGVRGDGRSAPADDTGSRLAIGRTMAATSEGMDVTSPGGENPAPNSGSKRLQVLRDFVDAAEPDRVGAPANAVQVNARHEGVTAGRDRPLDPALISRPAAPGRQGSYSAHGVPEASGRPDWTTMDMDDRDRMLTDACKQGLSAAQTAALFKGASRSAILGRLKRLRDAEKKPRSISAAANRTRNIRGGLVSKNRLKPHPGNIARKAEGRKRDPGITITSAAAWDPIEGTTPITLVEIGPRTCRWPVYDGDESPIFCGAECEPERSYCDAHRRLSYQPPSQRQKAAMKAAERVS